MAIFEAKSIRNVLLLGHSGCGKTSLAEALAFAGGAIPRMGNVADGTTLSDYNEDEKERKHSISSSLVSFVTTGVKINLIDVPGSTDFVGEIIGGLHAADACIVLVNASAGIEIGTERGYRLAKENGVPCFFFVNMLDKEHADFDRCIDDIKSKFRKHCVVVEYPVGKHAGLTDTINVISPGDIGNFSDADQAHLRSLRDELVEGVAESDDKLLEEYLERGEILPDELDGAFKKSCVNGDITPILCGSAVKNVGIKTLLEMIVRYFPAAADVPGVEAVGAVGGEKVRLAADSNGPFAGIVFKTLSDPYLGQISLCRIASGRLQANTGFYNVDKNIKEKIGSLFTLTGKRQQPVDAAFAGDIVCIAKLKDTVTGNSISDEKHHLKLPGIQFPEPAISFSLKPKSRGDEDKIANALHKLTAEDPTFKVSRDEQTKEMIVAGMGDVHIAMMINRMRARYGVQVELGTPKVAYRETITGKGDAQYRHKKQTGGAGQFAEVWLRIEPLMRGAGFEFVDEVVGGAIPRPFVVSCEKGIRSALDSGTLAGFPVTDVRAIVYDGKTHPVDSKDIAFQVAARNGFKEAMQKARAVLLEPIMDVDISVPDDAMGDVTGSLNSRRGRVMGMDPGEGSQTIKAKIPLEEMYKYINELKSITGGRGSYAMSFSHYEVVPGNIAQAIIEKAKLTKKEGSEE